MQRCRGLVVAVPGSAPSQSASTTHGRDARVTGNSNDDSDKTTQGESTDHEWPIPEGKLRRKLAVPSQGRMYYIRYAMKMGWSIERISVLFLRYRVGATSPHPRPKLRCATAHAGWLSAARTTSSQKRLTHAGCGPHCWPRTASLRLTSPVAARSSHPDQHARCAR